MNLFLFNENEIASTYGIGTYLNELTQALVNTSIHVYIIHLYSNRQEFEIEIVQLNSLSNHVEHWHIPEVRKFNTRSRTIQKVESYYQNVIYLLRLHIKDTRNLVFHFNFNLCQSLAKELKATFNCKTVTTVHYLKWMLELQGNFVKFNAIKSKPENQMDSFEQMIFKTDKYENVLFKEVDRLISLSEFTQSYLIGECQINPDKITFIPNGLEDIKSQTEIDKEVLRRKWKLAKEEFLILFAGRIQAVKGLDYLIRAFRKVLEIKPNCRLIIAGNGEYDVYMKECEDIWTQITWTGLISKDNLYELYSIVDIGVMPSFHEQCSYVAIEMMRHGLPIISSTSTGLKEMIDDGKTGFHIPVLEYENNIEIDTNLLAEKILYIHQNPQERNRMEKNARKRYEELYSIDLFRKNMLRFYQSF